MAIIGIICFGVGVNMEPIFNWGPWMDIVSIYICPLGAGLAGIMFFWVLGKKFVEKEVNKARTKPLGSWFYPLCKYLFCGLCILVLIAGAVMGGIG